MRVFVHNLQCVIHLGIVYLQATYMFILVGFDYMQAKP